jgi:biopolymer transport protein ExbD/biopolymer transport protein TolR
MIELSGLAGIMLFFLILFMMPASLPRRHFGNVDLAPVDGPKAMPGALKEDALQVAVTRDGTIYLNESRVRIGNLVPLLRQGVRQGSERKVYLRADARARYADVKAVLGQIRLAGIENVALMTEQRDHDPPH